jgi:hypothetical protein
MLIRHVVAAADVDARLMIRDATRARHCLIVAGRIEALGGAIDPLTHLNADAPRHLLAECIIADHLAPGAPVRRDADGFVFARTPRSAYAHRGAVDVEPRRAAWRQATAARREAGP